MTKSAERSLEGRVILVTRPASRGEELARLLEERGASVEQRPTIVLLPPADAGPAMDALARLAEFEWLLFTSSNGVRFFFELLGSSGHSLKPGGARLAAIGPATARELESRGHPAALVARESRAEGLAEALREEARPGQRVLLVRPEETRPALARGLEAIGLRVEAVPFYRNAPATGVEAIAVDVADGRYDAIVFTAPSTLRRLLAAGGGRSAELRERLRGIALVAIGPVTASAIEAESQVAAAVADRPSDRALIEALERAFGR